MNPSGNDVAIAFTIAPISINSYYSGWRSHIDDVHDGSANRVHRYRTDVHRPEEPQRQGRRQRAPQVNNAVYSADCHRDAKVLNRRFLMYN